jgi:large subunit ribosomal protein L29
MKEMSLSQKLQQLSVEDLQNRLEGTRRDLFGLRLNAATSQLKDYSQYKKLRRDIARIMTAIRAKEDGRLPVVKKS